MYYTSSLLALTGCLALVLAMDSQAQLNECAQIDSNGNVVAPGGCINKTLQEQIGAGHGDEFTPGSAVYLIKRDPARSIRRGRQLFQRKFSLQEGHGPRVNATSSGDITATRALGAGLADSCAACHGRPRGSAGFGGDVVTRPDSRDAPHLFGLGLVEQLAEEMTEELRAIRDQAIVDAQNGTGNGDDDGDAMVIVEADFDRNRDGFHFVSDVFATDNPRYSRGRRVVVNSGQNRRDGALQVLLGNRDNARVDAMSGGWQYRFDTDSAVNAVLTLRFNLIQSGDYEDDEFSIARVSIDDQVFDLAEITGNGNGGGSEQTGLSEMQLDVSLSAGSHTLTLGGFNNQKTQVDEFTRVLYHEIKLSSGNGGGSGGGSGTPGTVTRQLISKGVDFGTITAFADGSVDASGVLGIDEDLRVRPFFHQGATASIREFIIGALKDEMGLQAWDPVLCAVTDSSNPQAMTSPAGFAYDPALDVFERPAVCSASEDGDGDGVSNEIDPALVDHLEFYLLNYFKPGLYRQTNRTQQGQQLLDQIGCSGCHIQNLTIDSDRRVADVETFYDPQRGIFNELFAEAETRFDIVEDSEPFPQLVPTGAAFVVENFYSDLKRHDLGPAFHEREYDGTIVTEFVTEPLWGVGSTAPYGHDGRSINLDSVIRRHGGAAETSKQAYLALSDNDQRKLQEFLQTLVLFPPDDTASNLNPGNPGTLDPQDPAEHGNINLGVLFQIPEEGGE